MYKIIFVEVCVNELYVENQYNVNYLIFFFINYILDICVGKLNKNGDEGICFFQIICINI